MHTKLCDLLGIKYPIIQGAMGTLGSKKIAGPALAAAVSNAGGLGVLASWGASAKELREAIRQTRQLTDKPFGVNLIPLSREFIYERMKIVLEEGVSIVTTGRGDPREEIVGQLKKEGVTVIPVVPTVALARRMESEGADAVVASGMEAGGHVGQVATLPLVPQVADAVKIPVIAAGGIADARGIVAAFALGACGVQMGTRFLATVEAGASESAYQVILRSSDEDTTVTPVLTGKPVRILADPEARAMVKEINQTHDESRKNELIAEIRRRSRIEDEKQIVPGGQAAGLIHEILTVKELFDTLMKETKEILEQLQKLR